MSVVSDSWAENALMERTADGLTIQVSADALMGVLRAVRGSVECTVAFDPAEVKRAFEHPFCGRYLSDADIALLFSARVYYADEDDTSDNNSHSRKV